jgi:hypothetical protein
MAIKFGMQRAVQNSAGEEIAFDRPDGLASVNLSFNSFEQPREVRVPGFGTFFKTGGNNWLTPQTYSDAA